MPSYFLKPEAAVNRAQEFIKVGQQDLALDTLIDVLRSKKHRSEVQKLKIVINHTLTLCVKLQKSGTVKDSLYQFRNITSNVEPAAFKEAVSTFLDDAESKAREAREQSQQAVESVEDLDQLMTPESLLLSTVSGEGTQDRTDRVLLTPWLKFLWESYRNILDLLRNNKTFELLYRDVAKRAFEFCLEYKRHSEFRKLCEMFRNHYQSTVRSQASGTKDSYSIDLSNPDSVSCLVQVRFAQMHAAVSLDLWQEAFKAIEEVHNLFQNASKHVIIKPKDWNRYYEKQAQVYWMANNRLFHAAALQRLYVLQREQKKTITPEDLQRLSSLVLLSTLAVPITPVANEYDRFLAKDDIAREKARKLTSLLRLPSKPTRTSLLADLTRFGILQHVPPKLKLLYQYLEVDFNPLELCANVCPILESLPGSEVRVEEDPDLSEPIDINHLDKPYSPPLCQYVEALKEALLLRLVSQVAQIYQTISFTRLQELAPFVTVWELEKVIVRAARNNNLQVRIDHITHSLHFGTDLNLNLKEETPGGPFVQAMPTERIRDQLCAFSQALQQAASLIFSEETQARLEKEKVKARKQYLKTVEDDHKALLNRKKIIENRKEFLENQEKAKRKKYAEEHRTKELKEREAEELRLKKEKEEREKEQLLKERNEMKMKIDLERLENLKKTTVGAKALADVTVDDLKELSIDDILSRQLKQMEREKQGQINTLKKQERKLDYLERAKRKEEISLLLKQAEEVRLMDKKMFEEQEKERITVAISEHEIAQATKSRLEKMYQDKEVFLTSLQTKRKKDWEEKMSIFTEKFDEAKANCLEERKKLRIEERKRLYIQEKKEEREKEEKEREEEERRKKEAEEKERLEKLEEIRKKQEMKEKEVERKLKRMQEEQQNPEEEDTKRSPSPRRRRESPPCDRPHTRYVPPGMRQDDYKPDRWRDRPAREEVDNPKRDVEGDWRRPSGHDYGREERHRDFHTRDDRPFRGDDRRTDRHRDDRRDDRYRGRDDRFRDERRDDRFRDERRDDRFRDERRDDRFRDERRDDRFRDDRRDDRFRDDRRDDRFRDDRRDDKFRDGRRDERFRDGRRDDRFRDDRRDDRFRDGRREDRFRDDRRDDRFRDDRGRRSERDNWRRPDEDKEGRGFREEGKSSPRHDHDDRDRYSGRDRDDRGRGRDRDNRGRGRDWRDEHSEQETVETVEQVRSKKEVDNEGFEVVRRR